MVELYIQGNYVPRNYGLLNGSKIDWQKYTGYAVCSIVLNVLMIIAIILMAKYGREYIFLISNYVCIGLFLLQIVTIGVLFIKKDSVEIDTQQIVSTKKDMLNLSEENNIIIFVFDAFDSSYLQELLNSDEKEKYENILQDFTYYPDTLGAYPTTKGSMPMILTGEWFENDIKYDDYIQQAYNKTNIYPLLKNNKYSIGVYTEDLFIANDCDTFINLEYGRYKISDYSLFAQKMYKLVFFNYMPHQLKKIFWIDTAEFDTLKSLKGSEETFSWDQLDFYDFFCKKGIVINDPQKSFRLYHISGPHEPYTFDESLKYVKNKEYDAIDEVKGCIELLRQFEEQLKNAEVYDNTTIIIMADHGYLGSWTSMNQNPIFMIKNKDESHNFRISDKEMSWEYLSKIFTGLAKGDIISEDYIANFTPEYNYRRFLRYAWNANWENEYLPCLVEYYSKGYAGDLNNIVESGREFSPGNETKTFTYKLGTPITFDSSGNAEDYNIVNIGDGDNWIADNYAVMKFHIDDDFNNLKLKFSYSTYKDNERVKLFANGNLIADYIASGTEEKEFIISGDVINDNVLTLAFELPDAQLPDNGDLRKLSLFMLKMELLKID